MQYDPHDTIAAIGTAVGGAPRGMVRLSGPDVLGCLDGCFRPTDASLQLAQTCLPSVIVGMVAIAAGRWGQLPCDLFLWPGRRSYTRQPTAELHTLGSPPLLQKLLDTLCANGARLAEPGEFTMRAFLAGRLDLTQAEAVLGVIDAHSRDDLHTALAQLAGGLSEPLAQLREQLLRLLAELEAGLDFVEEDIEFISPETMHGQLNMALETIFGVQAQLSSRGDSNELPRVVLSGPPNAGKSSLFNALINRFSAPGCNQRALVSSQAGTTRDFVTAQLTIDGIACELVDTAGVESDLPANSIAELAQAMTSQQQTQARLIVLCCDASSDSTVAATCLGKDRSTLVAHTKCDLSPDPPPSREWHVACSSVRGDGLQQLANLIRLKLVASDVQASRCLSHTATRCAASLRHAEDGLTQALQLVAVDGGEELIAVEIRGALHFLGEVVGAVYTDDILDRIFGQFCIGK